MIFLKKFDNQKNIRFPMFEYALKLAQKRNLKVLVETGTSRGKNKFFFFRKYNWKDGMSTIIFGEFANFINGKLYTCDVSKENIKSAMNFTKSLENNITFCVDDSVNFLNFAGFNKMTIVSGTHADLNSLREVCVKNKSISFGSSGVGSTSHLSAYYYATKYLNCKDVLSVPYKGVSMVYPDLKAGRIDFMADFSISVDNFIQNKYLNQIEEIKENDLTSWHIFVSNKVTNKDAEIVKDVFDSMKVDKEFAKNIESKFQIQKFHESKDQVWLKTQFNTYKIVIESLPKTSKN